MGSLFRSQPMLLVNIFMSHDAVHTVVDELARLGVVQFRDLNPGVNAFHRNFVNDVRRIDEMEKKLTIFQQKMTEHSVRTDFFYPHADLDADTEYREETHLTVLASLENQFEELVHELQQLDQYQAATRRDITSAIEERNVLERAHHRWLEGSERFVMEAGADEDEEIHLLGGEQRSTNLSFVAGVIDRPSLSSFRRVLWRVTHGNLFMHDDDIDEPIPHPKTNKPIDKTAFIIFTQGEVAQNKIRKICEAFSASLFPISPNPRAREQHITELSARIENLRRVYDVNTRRTREILTQVEPRFDGWRCRILKEKLIYHTMNLFDYDIQRKTLIAEGWVPEKRLPEVQEALETAATKCRALVAPVLHVVTDTQEVPPTFFETNKYSVAFQNIIDAYGVPDYQEVNPASFTIISFPFLFGVMFGDLGHGTFLLMFALYLIFNERQMGATRLNEIIKMCFDGRYVLVLMGIFAMYVGFLYNECFAVPMNFFGASFFDFGGENTYLKPYPVGVNPVWKVADNTLLYYNSLKMKMSIIIGVFHMTFGIVLSAFNGVFFRKHWEHKYDIWAVFVPQLIFFLAIFGYMTWLIIFKWCVNWMNIEGFQAPKLLTVMIAMFQQIGSLNPDYYMFYGQHPVQVTLVILALICVPWMLLPKPFLLRRDWRNAHPDWREREAAKARGEEYHPVGEADEPGPIIVPSTKVKSVADGTQYTHLPNDFDDSDDDHHHESSDETVVPVAQHSGAHHHEEEFDFGEIFVHQMIHTIEFVLGAISNTASYLRLWALSLAHSELAEVFLDRVALLSLKPAIAVAPWIGFGAWAGLTWGVLLGMESISAFLHALRLHWVEFMNKFYHGTGHAFEPVSHAKTLITQESD